MVLFDDARAWPLYEIMALMEAAVQREWDMDFGIEVRYARNGQYS